MRTGRSIWSTGWRLAVGGALLFWIFHAIFAMEGARALKMRGVAWDALSRAEQWRAAWSEGPRQLWETLRFVPPGALLASLVFMGLTVFLGVIRWRMVMRVHGLELSFGRASEISLVAQFFNSFLLGSTGGDVMKAYYAARETHHKKTEAVVTVLVDRLIGLFAMLLFASLMMLPNLPLLTSHRRLAVLAGFILLMLAGCGSVVVLSLWGGLSRAWPRGRLLLKRLPKGESIERALDACRHFGRDRSFLLKALVISMALNVCCVLQIMSLAGGLQILIPPAALFLIVPVIVCISALPISPSGLGVRENLYVLMLAVPEINVEATRALSLSLLAYAGFLVWSIVGGIVYLVRKESDHLDEIAATRDGE